MQPQSVGIIICLLRSKEAIIVLICAAIPTTLILADAFKFSVHGIVLHGSGPAWIRSTSLSHCCDLFIFQVKIDKVSIFSSSFLNQKVRGRPDCSVFDSSNLFFCFFFNLLCGFTGTLRNMQHAPHRKGQEAEKKRGGKRQKMTLRLKIFGWVVQRHGYKEEFLNPREGKLLFEQ